MKNISYPSESKAQNDFERVGYELPARYQPQTFRGHSRTGYPGCGYGIDLSETLDDALQKIRDCITNDISPANYAGAISDANSGLGNRTFMRQVTGLEQRRRPAHAHRLANNTLHGPERPLIHLDAMAGGMQPTVEASSRAGPLQFNKEVIDKFKSSKSRLIFLDYDGTLVGFHEDPMKAVPDDELHEIIERLTRCENTKVVVTTGRKREEIFSFLGGHENLEFVAEHGMWRKKAGDKDWQPAMELDLSWKEEIRLIIKRYVNIMPNSYIEEKVYSLGWHYRPVQNTVAAALAGRQLEVELKEYFRQAGREEEWAVTNDKMVVEINTAAADKGTSASVIAGEGTYDLILAMGDSETDEFMFRALSSHQTVKVGTGVTAARHTVKDVAAVRNLLACLGKL